MNVYTCLYRGNLGYGCRLRERRWMFVPELGQPDRSIHRDVSLGDLTFANPHAKSYELDFESQLTRRRFTRWLRPFASRQRPRTIGGLLLAAI